jgi:hypothetical protein
MVNRDCRTTTGNTGVWVDTADTTSWNHVVPVSDEIRDAALALIEAIAAARDWCAERHREAMRLWRRPLRPLASLVDRVRPVALTRPRQPGRPSWARRKR